MKKIIYFLFSVALFGQPDWYYSIAPSSNTYIGYGQGQSEAKAKEDALNSIASQISTQTENSFKKKTEVNNDSLNKSMQEIRSQKSAAKLSDYKILKQQKIENTFYVAISYENLPSLQKFAKKVIMTLPENEVQNSYIKNTFFAKKLKDIVGKNVAFDLRRKDRLWYVGYGSIMQVLDDEDFSDFFKTIHTKNVDFMTDTGREVLYEGDQFYFKTKSNKDGFISIISVYEDGTVATLVKNIKVKAGELTNIPDKDFESVLEAGLITPRVETYDLYIALWSDEKVSLDMFARADENLIEDERYKNFHELITYLNDKEFSSLKIVTKPR